MNLSNIFSSAIDKTTETASLVSPLTKSVNKDYLEKREVVKRLIYESTPDNDYFIMLSVSTVITTLGLLLNSTSVVIGGMLISPILTPLLAFGLGFVTFNQDSILRSVWSLFRAIILILAISFLIAYFSKYPSLTLNEEVQSRLTPSWAFVHIAILSGFAGTYSWIKVRLSALLPGVAIAVALLPPLCVVGIGAAQWDTYIMSAAFDMFIVNFVGILISSVAVFSLLGFQKLKTEEKKQIKIERAVSSDTVSSIANITNHNGRS